jgi:uncharacterized protein YndB with AHSA1/START domain
MAENLVEREILIEASRERVWAVLTEPEHVASWFGDGAELDLRPGGSARFSWSEHGSYDAIIDRVEPPSFFSYRWANRAGTQPVAGNTTLVEFTLTEVFAGTLLRVIETGFASLHIDPAAQQQAVADHTEGWSSELAELKEYAERPTG